MMGRPPKPKSEVFSAELRIRMRKVDRKKLDRAAAKLGKETSTWARDVLLSLADDLLPRKGKSA